MTASISQRLYPRLPIVLQNAACWYYGRKEAQLRFGEHFHRKLEELTASDLWSAGEIEAYQNEQIQRLIRHAYEQVPYYRERMRALGLTPQDVRTREDLPKLPILTKEEVRHNLPLLVAGNASKQELVLRHTSGSTGKALDFYSSKAGVSFQWAVWWRHRRRFGVEWGARHVNFTGKLVVPPEQSRPPYWRWNTPMHQVLINMQHLTPDRIEPIVEFLNRHRFDFYSGYPSVIHAFAHTALQAGLELTSPPRMIFTGAENLLDFQRRHIEALGETVISDQYGTSEGCGNASQCSAHVYHEDFEFGILECVDPEPVGDGRTRGRIVCTGFANPEFPFIRYEIGDSAIWEDPARPCSCGRSSRVLVEIEGRLEDYVLTPEGRRIMRFDYIFKGTDRVKESQIVQREPGALTVRVVRRPEYDERDEEHIRRQVHAWISPRMKVSFEYPEEIEREAGGKFRAVKSLLKPHPGERREKDVTQPAGA